MEIKDLGALKYFLGIKITNSKAGIDASQQKYTLDLLKETSIIAHKFANTLINPNNKLRTKGDTPQANK